MAIIVHLEPPGLGMAEGCVFCTERTRYWEARARYAICQKCAADNTLETLAARVAELKARKS